MARERASRTAVVVGTVVATAHHNLISNLGDHPARPVSDLDHALDDMRLKAGRPDNRGTVLQAKARTVQNKLTNT